MKPRTLTEEGEEIGLILLVHPASTNFKFYSNMHYCAEEGENLVDSRAPTESLRIKAMLHSNVHRKRILLLVYVVAWYVLILVF